MEKSIVWIDDVKVLTVNMEGLTAFKELTPIIEWQGRVIQCKVKEIQSNNKAILTLEEELPLGFDMYLKWGDKQMPIYSGAIVRTPWFDKMYDASTVSLGPDYSEFKTIFSVWAPTATRMVLHLNNDRYVMDRKEAGVWMTTVEGDWNGALYDFEVTINNQSQRVNDPNAKSMTANSGRSVVIDLKSTDPDQFRNDQKPKVEHVKDAIIYELHVRDATISQSSGVKNKGKYLGLTEIGTKTDSGYSTGLSYIKELGCTHVQLLPINDFARIDELQPNDRYNWGYDPLYYQVPEGSYATDATVPISRVLECKQMIQAFHSEGLLVILDVVFNHVFDQQSSAFETLVPGYYFRYKEDGFPSNGTGVGNDLATERKMVRKFILDCIDYWLKEYRVDGFRFDLMGIIDIETMKEIKKRCDQEKEPILLLGEGWELDTPLPAEKKATISQSHQLEGISFFNDRFRDFLKGNLFDLYDLGFVNGEGRFIEHLAQLVSGSCLENCGVQLFKRPTQSVNYVECHDNHTLWDRLELSNAGENEQTRKRMHQIATGLTIISQGIPFLHAGQEWFRTKKGDENSYISGDEINQLDWNRRVEEDKNIQWIKALISLRKQYNVFRLSSVQEIQKRLQVLKTPDPLFGYSLIGDSEEFVIFINPMKRPVKITMKKSGTWEQLISNYKRELPSMNETKRKTIAMNPLELLILKKNL
ncbi:type I pullulanase [Halalkalibacter nanhaiisediminis]|uniref:Pullulanase n=1 Tax=Halalkalibacter nanhaiisediminis TaxID=688079 RepID=A0A562QQT8_9BACI|nr:type I pullulanase [Halalkalibacter nanhaiisediminis]TWI59109.1 pullulanase [Halalkalibacter nanhaiisediminis]